MASAAEDRNWAELLPELLTRVVERLSSLDSIRFSAVCTSWASAPRPPTKAPQMPYLLLPGDAGEQSDSCTLLSLTQNCTHRLSSLPEIRGKWFIGSQDGWLVLLDEFSNPSLFNPLTRAQIQLPSIDTLQYVDPIYGSDGSLSGYRFDQSYNSNFVSYTLDKFRYHSSIKKLIFAPNPTAASYAAVGVYDCDRLLFCNSTEQKWTAVVARGVVVDDAIYRDGRFLVVSNKGEVYAIDAYASSDVEFPMITGGFGGPLYEKRYLVDVSGDLLQLCRSVPGENEFVFLTKSIEVWKLESGTNAWLPLRSLGDNALFVGTCYSLSLLAQDIPGLKPNCIYFTDDYWDMMTQKDAKKISRDVGVYNLEDASVDLCFPRDPPLNWPPPTWILPTLV